MPVMKVYRNGVTMGRAPKKNDHERAKRGEVLGWSPSAARRNLAFLRSVEVDKLTGYGYTATFTLKICPSTSEHWKRLREALFKRFFRMGMICGHWVTEWQKRGVPHLHGIFYFPRSGMNDELVNAWLAVADEFVVSAKAQKVLEVTHIVGWFKYVAKHASRGYQHYQRASDSIPEGWKKTGRVWGYVGVFPLATVKRYQVDEPAFFRLRRLSRQMELSNVRSSKGNVGSAVARARRRFKHNKNDLSRLMGISEWLPQEWMDKLIMWMLSEGYLIRREGTEILVTPDRDFVFDPETGEILK